MEKGWAGAHGPGTAARTSPPRREDLAQDVLMYPEPSLTGAQGNLCCSPSCLWPPQDLPLSLCSPPLPATGSWGGCAELHPLPQLSPEVSKGLLIFLLLTSVRKEVEPVHEGKARRQHLSCSFSLNGRDSCSRWHELAYPTYMHLLASRQLRGTNQTSLFWFGGKKRTPNHHFCVFKWKWHHPLTAMLTCLCFTSHRNVGQSVKEKKKKEEQPLFGKVLDLFFLS